MEEIKGIVYKLGDVKQITERFSLREVIIQEDLVTKYGSFTSYYPIQATNNKISLLDLIEVGDEVTVKVSINGRRYIRKDNGSEGFMVSLNLFEITPAHSFTSKGTILSPVTLADIDKSNLSAIDNLQSGTISTPNNGVDFLTSDVNEDLPF